MQKIVIWNKLCIYLIILDDGNLDCIVSNLVNVRPLAINHSNKIKSICNQNKFS